MSNFKSCWSLNHHLEMSFLDRIHACCVCFRDSQGVQRGMVRLVDLVEDRFPAAAIRDARSRINDAIAADQSNDCRECVHLASRDWGGAPYLVHGLTLNFWTHCNLACKYCFTASPGFQYRKVSYSIPAVVRDMLEGRHLDPAGQVTWGGGDISALPEFNETAQLFIDYGVMQDFKTSAFKFLVGVARAIAAEKGLVEVSVDAGTRETYADYKGKDAWVRVVENILRYREHGAVKLKYIADFCNIGEADINGFCDLAVRARPSLVTVTPEYNSAWQRKFDPQTIQGMARLLFLLRQAGLPVRPADDAEGEVLFPHIWSQVKEDMDHMAQ
jgi:hypothetical protein